jgi:hypothetical protein
VDHLLYRHGPQFEKQCSIPENSTALDSDGRENLKVFVGTRRRLVALQAREHATVME